MMKKIVIVAPIGLLVIASSVYWYLQMSTPRENPRLIIATSTQTQISTLYTPTSSQLVATTSVSTASTNAESDHPGMKLYHNEEFGFEFWYPEGWTITEQRNLNPYIKFNVVAQFDVHTYYQPFYVLVSTREHALEVADAIKDHDTPTSVTIDGRSGIRHEYDEETHYIDYDFVFGESAIFIGNENKSHLPEFNQILSTFKFLK